MITLMIVSGQLNIIQVLMLKYFIIYLFFFMSSVRFVYLMQMFHGFVLWCYVIVICVIFFPGYNPDQ